jgi:hypothetical protein
MHHIIIALSAVAVVALTYMLQELRRRSRVVGDHGDAACPSPSKQNGRPLRGATPIQPSDMVAAPSRGAPGADL